MALPAHVRHGYGAGALGYAIANTSVMFFLLKFLVDGAGLSPVTAGTVLLVAKGWDAVVDPLIGRALDVRPAYRSWIARATLPLAVLFAALWWGIPLHGPAQAVAYGLLLVLYSSAYSAVTVPYGALTTVLTDDYDDRTRLNAARMGWSMVGGILAGVGLPMMLEVSGWRVAGCVLAACIVPALLVTVRATAGRERPVRPDAGSASPWSVLESAAFRRTAGLFICAWTPISVLSALVPFFAQHVLGRKDLLDALFAAIQISALLAVPLVAALAVRVQKHRAYAIGMASWSVVLLALAAVPAGDVALTLGIAVLCGPGVAAAHVLPWSMLPDVVEADRVETGRDRAGAFYGAMTFLEQSATAVALWGLGIGLEVSGYVEGAAVQGPGAVSAIRWLIGPVPAAVLAVAAVVAWRSPPLTREAHAALVARLRPSAS